MIPISLGLHPLPNRDAWPEQNPKVGGLGLPLGPAAYLNSWTSM